MTDELAYLTPEARARVEIDRMLAAAHRSVEEMRELIGATSLHYLSVEGMQEATTLPEDAVCRACFTRDYPTRVPQRVEKLRFEPAQV